MGQSIVAMVTGKSQLRATFDAEGYVICRGLFNPEIDFVAIIAEYDALLGQLAAQWMVEGRLDTYDPEMPFAERLLAVQQRVHGLYQGPFDISLNPFLNDPPAFLPDSPIHAGPAVFALLTHPRLLDAVETLLGPEITCAPIQHVRMKPPEASLPSGQRTALTGQSFWHQDLGVVQPEADASDMVSAVVAVTDMDEVNGCIIIAPGSHRGTLLHHCRTPEANGIPDSLIGTARIPVELKAGDVLFLHRLTAHGSLPNRSAGLRWSFDLRYLPTGQPHGRDFFPGFVARSRVHPDRVLDDASAWQRSWMEARRHLATMPMPSYTRWNPADLAVCPECSTEAAAG